MRQKIYIDRDWLFTPSYEEGMEKVLMSDGQKVCVPHTVAVTPFNYFDESIYQMVSCYQRVITAPKEWENAIVEVTFEAAAHKAEVFLNGRKLGEHASGYTAFTVDLSEHLVYGEENLLTVKLDSRETLDQPPFGFVVDYMTYGGIYRDVYLTVRDVVSMKDVFLMPSLMQEPATEGLSREEIGEIQIEGNLVTVMELTPKAAELARQQRIMLRQFLDDKEISSQPLSPSGKTKTLTGPVALWDIENPIRYRITTQLVLDGEVVDQNVTFIGFRNAVFRRDGFYLNGRKVLLRGLNRHQSYPYVGYAMPESMQRLDAKILKEELGANAVRTSHYPQSQDFIDECDRIGLLVFTEFPGWQHIGGEKWKEQAVENVREMITQYRNHASIILWGVRINESVDCDELYEKTNRLARELDPTRPTGGVRCNTKMHLLEDVYTYNDFSYNGDRKIPGIQKKEKVTSDVSKPYLVSEYNGHMYPTKSFDWEEHQKEHTLRHAKVLDAVKGAGDVAGSFAWCMFDYNTHKDFGSGDRICYHGVMDMFRNPKMAASVYEAQQTKRPVLAVTSSMDIGEHPASVRGDTYIITNADSVRMYKNDLLIKEYTNKDSVFKNLEHGPIPINDYIGNAMKKEEGFGNRQNELVKTCLNEVAIHGYKITKKVLFAALRLILFYRMKPQEAVDLFQKYIGDWGGSSKVYRFDAVKDGKVCATIVKSPMKKRSLKARCSSTRLCEKQTYDVAEVRISAVDENGNTLSFLQAPVEVTVSGPLEIIGPKVVTLQGGMAGVYLKTTGSAGEAQVKLSLEGAKSKLLRFTIEVCDTI
ncbi:beta-galactosidase [Lachnospiraceae bacterium KHCPX20]|nr:beta-galactosidase [Lachnospiraceae bacterium KHCPX20]